MSYLIRGSCVFTDAKLGAYGVLKDAAVYITEDTIREIGSYTALPSKYPDAVEIGGADHWVLPGIIDGHHHGRGLTFLQCGQGYDFLENALLDWFYSVGLPPELAAQIVAWKHIRSGSTTVHHNAMPDVWDGKTLETACRGLETYRKIGMRVAYSTGIRDTNYLVNNDEAFYQTLPPHLREFAKPLIFIDHERAIRDHFDIFHSIYKTYNNGLTNIFPAPGWAHGATDEYLRETKAVADALGGLMIHIHTLQTAHQKAYGMERYGKSLLMHLADMGMVDEHLVLGHAVWANEDDIDLLACRRASITHHPSCNLLMRNGITPIYYMHKAGVNIALGLDEKTFNGDDDAISELRMIFCLHRLSGYELDQTPALSPYEILAMGTNNAARVLGLENKVGRLAVGMKADLITVDTEVIMNDPWTFPDIDPGTAFIHRARGAHVQNVMINGTLVMKDRQSTTMDIDALYHEIRTAANKGLTPEEKRFADFLAEIKPYEQRWYAHKTDFPKEPFYHVNARR